MVPNSKAIFSLKGARCDYISSLSLYSSQASYVDFLIRQPIWLFSIIKAFEALTKVRRPMRSTISSNAWCPMVRRYSVQKRRVNVCMCCHYCGFLSLDSFECSSSACGSIVAMWTPIYFSFTSRCLVCTSSLVSPTV